MSTKHWTPGPWIADCLGDIETEDGESIATTGGITTQDLANALLMAAAPSMYDALDAAPILSAYHGADGFETERFVADYEAWMAQRRAALAASH